MLHTVAFLACLKPISARSAGVRCSRVPLERHSASSRSLRRASDARCSRRSDSRTGSKAPWKVRVDVAPLITGKGVAKNGTGPGPQEVKTASSRAGMPAPSCACEAASCGLARADSSSNGCRVESTSTAGEKRRRTGEISTFHEHAQGCWRARSRRLNSDKFLRGRVNPTCEPAPRPYFYRDY